MNANRHTPSVWSWGILRGRGLPYNLTFSSLPPDICGIRSTTRIGYSHSTMTNDERMRRESSLIATIGKRLPEFAKACADDTELVLLHQDAFAADYQEGEYMLLGMAIKRKIQKP